MLRDSTALLLSDFLVINMHRRCYSGKRSVEWVSRLPAVVKALNNEKTRLIGLKPKDAIKAKTVSQKVPHFSRPFGINEKKLPDGIIVIFLLLVSLKVVKEEQQTLFGLLRYIDLVLR